MLDDRVALGRAPIIASLFSPLMKIMVVGMLRIPYSLAVEGLSSVFNLKHLSLPAYSFASSLITGWITRHGPHQEAQNSTRTGPSALRTRDCHVASVTVGTAMEGKGRRQMNIKKDWGAFHIKQLPNGTMVRKKNQYKESITLLIKISLFHRLNKEWEATKRDFTARHNYYYLVDRASAQWELLKNIGSIITVEITSRSHMEHMTACGSSIWVTYEN